MAHVDAVAQQDYAIPGMILMENAGRNAYRALSSRMRSEGELDGTPRSAGDVGTEEGRRSRHIVFVCGNGNNGGDAMVMARACFEEGVHRATVLLARGTAKGSAEQNLTINRNLGVRIGTADVSAAEEPSDSVVSTRDVLESADLIVDGISGTGTSGGLRPPVSTLVDLINEHPAAVYSVDVPSGISDGFSDGLPAVAADVTLTMGTPKQCLYLPSARSKAGDIVTVPVGFPKELLTNPEFPVDLAELSDLGILLPPLRRQSYKMTRGVVAVFAGALGTGGAALLSAEAAARSSAGMTHLFVDPDAYGVVAGAANPSLMVHPASDSVTADLARARACVAGPGWGVGEVQKQTLRTLASSGTPTVLDADGLNTYADMAGGSATAEGREFVPPAFSGECVLTPHPGEFRRLARAFNMDTETPDDEAYRPERQPDLLRHVSALADASGCVVCYKSHVVYIAAPSSDAPGDGTIRVVDGMTPELATAGAGDVLAGLIAGLLARGIPAAQAAVAGVLIHQEAGRRACRENGWFIASDLLPEIGRVVADFTETVYEY